MITESFLTLLKEKTTGEITVKELCENAHINRATFYAHYENIFDLADEIRQVLVGSIVETVTGFSNEDSLSEMAISVCRCIADNAENCEIIFGRYADADFADSVVEMLRARYLSLWRECGGNDEDEMNYLFTFMAYGGLAVLRSWVQSGMTQSSEYIASFLVKNVKINGFESTGSLHT